MDRRRDDMMDLILVLGYFLVMLLVGWRARGGSADAYWVADRRYGLFPVSASLTATIFGASSTLGIIGLGYSRGLTGAWWSLIGGVALIPFALLLAGRIRHLGVYTLPDILHRAYGSRVSMAGGGIIALAWCGVVAAQIVAGALLLESLVPLDSNGALISVSVVFVLYTLWGGQLSVVRTDAWQILLFVGALLATLALVLGASVDRSLVPGGIPDGHASFPTSGSFGWYQLLIFYPLIVGMPYLVGPDIYSRVLCARTEGVARRASLIAATAVVPLSFLLAGLGMLMAALYPGIPPEAALPTALSELAPPGVRGIIVVGILGAIMSSADTTLVSAATILSINVAAPILDLDERARLRWTRVSVVAVGLVAWAVASFRQGIIDALLLAYTVFVGGVAIPTLASFWKDRLGVTAQGAFWAVVVGGGSALLGAVGEGPPLVGVVGEEGVGLLRAMLGTEYQALLPLVLSTATLFGVSRFRIRRGGG